MPHPAWPVPAPPTARVAAIFHPRRRNDQQKISNARWDLLGHACNGGQARSCAEIGELYEVGDPALPKQPILAEMSLRRGCHRGNADACVGLGRVLLTKPGAPPSPEARSSLERGCATRTSLGCAALKVALGEQRAVIADPATKQALVTAWSRGNARACANSALFDAAMGNMAMAKPALQRACTMGDAWGCYLSKQVK